MPRKQGATASETPVRQLLLQDDVKTLDGLFVSTYKQAVARRASEPLTRYMHLPKLPEMLSLSIVGLVALNLLGTYVELAPFPHDLVDGHGRTIAVKGTGATSWITFTKTDHQSDILVWVDYRDRLHRGERVRVFDLPIDGRLSEGPGRLTLAQLEVRCRPRSVMWFTP